MIDTPAPLARTHRDTETNHPINGQQPGCSLSKGDDAADRRVATAPGVVNATSAQWFMGS